MSLSPQVDLEAYRTRGYVVVKKVIPVSEMQRIRSRIEQLRDRELAAGKNFLREGGSYDVIYIMGDLPGKEELREFHYVIFDPRVIEIAKQILGEKLVYFGDSSVQMGEGPRGFHKDNVTRYDPEGADWKGDYPLVRIGIYLKDHTRVSGGLKVRVGSHLNPSHHHGKAINVESELGDIVAWSLRTTHSGNNVRMKGFPSLCLHPRAENLIPSWLKISDSDPRIAIFCTFGASGEHLDRYIQYQASREDCREYMKRSCVNPEILDLAQKSGVEIRMPIAEYGSLHPRHQPPALSTRPGA